MPFIQVTEIATQGHRRGPVRRDLWVNVEEIRSVYPVIDNHGANCMITAIGSWSWWVEETAAKVVLMLEEAEGKQGYQVLAAALKEHARALSLKWG